MACCLSAPSHYVNQCWQIIKGVLRSISQEVHKNLIHNMGLESTLSKLLWHPPTRGNELNLCKKEIQQQCQPLLCYSMQTSSISLLLMPWLLTLPNYQWLWHRLWETREMGNNDLTQTHWMYYMQLTRGLICNRHRLVADTTENSIPMNIAGGIYLSVTFTYRSSVNLSHRYRTPINVEQANTIKSLLSGHDHSPTKVLCAGLLAWWMNSSN